MHEATTAGSRSIGHTASAGAAIVTVSLIEIIKRG
jgi:hypothetical protein